jgi:integrase
VSEKFATVTSNERVSGARAAGGRPRGAYASRRIPADPTVGAQSRRRRSKDDERVGPDQVPTRAEVAAIWQAAPANFRAAIALGASGVRVGEVLGLTVDRIDVEQRLVTIDRQLQRIGGK